LGPWRFRLLRAVQASVLPEELRPVLGLEPDPVVDALLRRYRFLPGGGDKLRPLHGALLPPSLAEGLRGAGRAPIARVQGHSSRSEERRRSGMGRS
jgi:hypothetical protein